MEVEQLQKEDVEFFFNKYKYNSDLIVNLERRLLKESYNYEKWHRMLSANSLLTHRLFAENEKYLDMYIRPVLKNPEQLRPETASFYLLHILFFLFENHIDSCITNDVVHAIQSVDSLMNTRGKFDSFLDLGIARVITGRGNMNDAEQCFVKALNQYPDLSKVNDNVTKIHMVFCCLYELLCQDMESKPDVKRLVDTVNASCKMLENLNSTSLYTQMWGKNADFPFHVRVLCRFMRIYAMFGAGIAEFAGDAEAVKTAAGWLENEFNMEQGEGRVNCMIYVYYYKWRLVSGEISKEEYIKAISGFYTYLKNNNIPLYVYPEGSFPNDDDPVSPRFADMLDSMKIFCTSFSFIFILVQELLLYVKDENMRHDLCRDTELYYIQMPYADRGMILDRFIIANLKVVLPCLKTQEECLGFVQTVFLHRQISTAIHFSMVSRLSQMCFERFYDKRPGLFSNLPGLETKQQISDFVRDAGLCHDIGKLYCTDLVNLHFRKISPAEVEMLRCHADTGAELANAVPALKKYADLIHGHHKSWDGKSGYPADFDNTKSPYKILIDLLTICDSIDAATDSVGRNYAAGKSFEELSFELQTLAGTRYSPDLVKMLLEDKELRDKISEMTGTGRTSVYYETYSQYVAPHITFMSDDEKTVRVFMDEDETAVREFYKCCYPSADFEKKVIPHIDCLVSGRNVRGYILSNKRNQIFGVKFGRKITSIDSDDYFFIDELLVLPAYRRKGFGTMIVSFAETDLQQLGFNKISMNIVKDFHSESFFWINGFSDSNSCKMEKNLKDEPV